MFKKIIKNICPPFIFQILHNTKRRISSISEPEKIFNALKNKERFIQETLTFCEQDFIVPDAPSFAWQVKEIFIDECYKFSSPISGRETVTIYDCGANIGTSVLWFNKNYPNAIIKAFEADNTIFTILKKNVGNCSNIEIFYNAIWVNEDELCFNSEGADGGSLINSFEKKETVKGIRLKNLLQNEKKVNFLKLDIEGAETQVIQDCKDVLHIVDNIFIEYHSFPDKKQELDSILSILTQNGFRYHLETITNNKKYFTEKRLFTNMDLQLNIFACKE